jgi:hypothetical protein
MTASGRRPDVEINTKQSDFPVWRLLIIFILERNTLVSDNHELNHVYLKHLASPCALWATARWFWSHPGLPVQERVVRKVLKHSDYKFHYR